MTHTHASKSPGAQEQEPLLTLTQASRLKWLPCRRNGKSPNVATLWRWAMRGCHGLHLRVTAVGGTLCTTESDLRSFFAELTRLREVR